MYGTVLVNMETGDVVDMLPDREAATVEAWLKAHPGAAVICRDRAGGKAGTAARGRSAATSPRSARPGPRPGRHPRCPRPASSGRVEGTVNKTVKRQMYGRAGFPLLRQRVMMHPA